MSWRALREVHLLQWDGSQLLPKALVKTFTRVEQGANYGFDQETGIGRALPRLSAPDFSVTLEGMMPNLANFLQIALNTNTLMTADPQTIDTSYDNVYDFLSNASPASDVTLDNIVISYGVVPNRIQLTLDESGLHGTLEYVAVDVTRAQGIIDVTNNERKIVAVDNNLYMPSTLPILEGQNQTVLSDVYPPETARMAASISLRDSSGNPIIIYPTSMQITADFNAQAYYTVTGKAFGAYRDVPQLSIEFTTVASDIEPLNVFRLGVQKLSSPATVSISNFIEVEIHEYVVQNDSYEISADYPTPRITILPLRYVVKDGSNNTLFGWH